MSKRKCPHCDSEHLEPGNLHSTGGVYFRPQNAKFLTLKTADIRLFGNICVDCGAVMLVGETSKLKELTARAAAH